VTNAGRLISGDGLDNEIKSDAISASSPNLSTFGFPIKAIRAAGYLPTNGGLFRPDHRKSSRRIEDERRSGQMLRENRDSKT
jgi:hypothetical protein